MKALSPIQNEIADLITSRYDAISKLDAIKFIKNIYCDTASIKDIIISYNFLTENELL